MKQQALSPQQLPRDERFLLMMNKLGVVYGRVVSEQMLSIYDATLEDIDMDSIAWGVFYMLRERESTFFPVPAEIRSWVEVARKRRADRIRNNQPLLPPPEDDPAYDEYREANWEYVKMNLDKIKNNEKPEFTAEAQMKYILEVTSLTREQILKFREE